MVMILFLVSLLILGESAQYPIVFTTVRDLNLFSPTLLEDMGVKSPSAIYNVISLDGWSGNNPLIGAA